MYAIPSLALAAVLALGDLATAADWPQWRGPNRDGKSAETGLLKSWPAGGPPVVWKTKGLGEGYSSMAIVNGVIYTQGQRGDKEYVFAFDAATGRKLWETETGQPYHEQRGHGPRGTPTIDGDRLYAAAADGALVCLELKTGKKIWAMNMVEKFGGRVPHWGISESPLVDGDHLIVMPGGRGASIVALNKKDGSPVWKSGSDSAGYSSAVLVTHKGARYLFALSAEGAMALRPDTGEILWRYNRVSNNVANIATPIFDNGAVFFSTDYGTGCALLKISNEGSMSEAYFNRDMKNHYSTSVLVDGYLYGYSSAILTAMKFDTGQVAWKDRSVGKGSVVYADGMLYALGEDGVLGLVEANPAKYVEKSRFEIQRGQYPTWTPPVIANGKLYLREQDNLYCYNIKASQ